MLNQDEIKLTELGKACATEAYRNVAVLQERHAVLYTKYAGTANATESNKLKVKYLDAAIQYLTDPTENNFKAYLTAKATVEPVFAAERRRPATQFVDFMQRGQVDVDGKALVQTHLRNDTDVSNSVTSVHKFFETNPSDYVKSGFNRQMESLSKQADAKNEGKHPGGGDVELKPLPKA